MPWKAFGGRMAKNGCPFHFFFSPVASVLTTSGPRGTPFSTHFPASSSHFPSPFSQSSGVWNEPSSRRLFVTVELGNTFLLLTNSLSNQSYHGAIGGA